MLDSKSIEIINGILANGGSVEIRKRKDEIVIIQIQGTVKYKVAIDG